MYMCTSRTHYGLRSQEVLQILVPKARIELGKKAFKYAAPSAWNDFQKEPKLLELITLGEAILKDREDSYLGHCNCL